MARNETVEVMHDWLYLPIGRICRICRCVQPLGHFSDEVPCPDEQVAR